jgi:hypothetical protein
VKSFRFETKVTKNRIRETHAKTQTHERTPTK